MNAGISVSPLRSAPKLVAPAAGAKERPSTRGSASRRGVTERAQESTPASAPLSGSPRNRKIPWGEQAPGRLGREDARNFGGGTLSNPSRSGAPTPGPEARRSFR